MSLLGQKRILRHIHDMSALPPKADIRGCQSNVRLVPCVDGSKLARAFFTFAALVGIQGRMRVRNIDSRRCSIGFDYCVIAAQQRVLQHIHPNSGQRRVRLDCPLSANSCRQPAPPEHPWAGLLFD